ncbi:hypothetical protein GCM10011575_35660 [Microlunatus endophyticus]|uniref:DUF1707 domain-containing protein n=1 Tax=Microlunatus endophyticus TaxID=1716077 RepID=A0A917SDC8_9ACTN|nr:hypothetical protein GCM10011575_35660 [Microlunatus endophyticus]
MGQVSGGYPVPQRIGDAERDQAAQFLQDHHAQGRLDPAEFDERLTAALQAKTQADLDRLFTDLPSPTPRSPGQAVEPAKPQPATPAVPVSKRVWGAMDVVAGAIWPITLIALFALRWHPWYLIFIPIIVSSIWGRRRAQENAERERLEAERKRQLDQGDSGPAQPPVG